MHLEGQSDGTDCPRLSKPIIQDVLTFKKLQNIVVKDSLCTHDNQVFAKKCTHQPVENVCLSFLSVIKNIFYVHN